MMKGKKVELPSGCYGSEMSAQSVHHLSASSRAYSTFFFPLTITKEVTV